MNALSVYVGEKGMLLAMLCYLLIPIMLYLMFQAIKKNTRSAITGIFGTTIIVTMYGVIIEGIECEGCLEDINEFLLVFHWPILYLLIIIAMVCVIYFNDRKLGGGFVVEETKNTTNKHKINRKINKRTKGD